ncbi:MAG: hypothetical protein ABFD60_11320 [Bryobacteraceae bacterium]
MAYIYGRNDYFFVAKQSDYKTIRHTDGTASLAAADACRHRTFTATPNRARINPSYKEAGSAQVFIEQSRAGRISGAASVTMPLFSGSGVGVEPDCGPIFESAFGAVTVGGATVTYTRAAQNAALVPLELWGFNSAGKRGVCAFGSIVNKLVLSGGQDTADLSADFISYAVLGQDRWGSALTAEKGGLTTWPLMPAAPVYTGSEMAGFTCQLTLDGTAYVTLRDWTVTINPNRQYDLNHCAIDGTEYFPQAPFQGMPEYLLSFSTWSVDTAALDTLLGKIVGRTSFDATLVIGSTAGGTYTLPMNNLVIPPEISGDGFSHEDGDERKAIVVPTLRCQATSTAAVDEIGPLVIS